MFYRKASLLIYIGILVATAFASEQVLDPVASFRFGNRQVRIWPWASNTPEVPPFRWGFRYDPVILPVVDENNRVLITRIQHGSQWRTDLVLFFDSPFLNALAFEEVKKVFKEVPGLLPENVLVLPVEKIVVTFPDVFESFSDVNGTSPAYYSCPMAARCFIFDNPSGKFRVSFTSPTEERAMELEDAIRSTQVEYEIDTYARLRNPGSPADKALDTLFGHLALLFTSVGSSSLSRRTQEVEKRVEIVENILGTIVNATKDVAYRVDTISSQLENATYASTVSSTKESALVENLFSNVSVQLGNISQELSQFRYCAVGGWNTFCTFEKCYCYVVIRQGLSWDAAQERCSSFGANLAGILSYDEQQFVGKLVSADTWIGLKGGSTTWADQNPLSFQNWKSGRTSDTSKCTEMDGIHKKWDEFSCKQQQHSVCKKEIRYGAQ